MSEKPFAGLAATGETEEGRIDFGKGRAQSFIASVSPDLVAREAKLPETLRAENSSRRSKLVKIYRIADELSVAREGFVACGKGCSHCCHMSIQLTSAEAERLGAQIGRPPKKVASTIKADKKAFDGLPCSFLAVDHSCSIYPHRPLACRTHASFEADNTKCHPSMMDDHTVSLVNFSGLEQALFDVSSGSGELLTADIRDFFPASD
jgi:Fe-S-cluster containining protein